MPNSAKARETPRLSLLNVSESFNANYGGGGAAYLEDICHLLAQRGHRVAVLCPESRDAHPYEIRRTEASGKITVFRINLPYVVDVDPECWGLGLLGWRRHQQRLAAAVGQVASLWSPDLVLLHLARPFGEDAFTPLIQRGIPIAQVLHDAWGLCMRLQLIRSPQREVCKGPAPFKCFECLYSNFDGTRSRAILRMPWRIARQGFLPLYRTWRRRALQRTISGTVAYSRFMHAFYAAHGTKNLAYIPMGINLAVLPASKPARPRVPLRFGFVAGFQPHKGVWDVLDAAAELKRQGLRFELHIWGPGSSSLAEEEFRTRGLEGTAIFRGVYSPGERWQVYSEMDVAIMATTWVEPFGRVISEAVASGAATIGPDIGGISEQVRHNETGLLYPFRDVRALRHQMERFLLEPDLLPRMLSSLPTILDTREAVAGIESFCIGLLTGRDSGAPAGATRPAL